MSVFEKKPVAILITVLVVILATIYSTNHFLGNACQEVTDSFYEGVETDGYRHASINSCLESRCSYANGLLTVASNYDELSEEADTVRDARLRLLEADSLHAKYTVNSELQNAVELLSAAMNTVSLSSRDQEMAETYRSQFDGAGDAIASSGYNEAVRAFERETFNVFPARFLALISGVKAPELFE